MKNSHHVGVQDRRSFYGDLHKRSDILTILLICVESDKIPLLHKLKQLYKRLPVGFLITIAYTANGNTVQVVHQDGEFISSIRIVIM